MLEIDEKQVQVIFHVDMAAFHIAVTNLTP
jgi:hypothetical protein